MSILQSIVLGIIQGITEFFPISSSGHLVVFPYFFNWDYPPLYFTVAVHFATLAAVVTVFYKEIFRIIREVILGIFIRKQRTSGNFKIGIFLIIASIPAAAAGFFLDDYVESLFSKPMAVAIFLLVTTLFLWLGELKGKRIEAKLSNGSGNIQDISINKYSSGTSKEVMESELTSDIEVKGSGRKKVRFNLPIAVMVGLGQAVAILPGVSRSGATISFARFFGIRRSEAVKFSFLLSIPVIFGTFIFELYRSSGIIFGSSNLHAVQNLIAGFLSSYLAGLFAVKFIVYLTRKRNLNIFAVYCICLSAAIFIFYMMNKFI
ncbi:MAG: undecaprenyl-diphosphate phosphatase [Actinobacteria bacterium]|nr:undecaprenyl-diphosphate phosphatase [Actinomycetota bacterium]